MDFLRISSRQNRRIKLFRKAKENRLPGMLLLEGTKLVEEALRCNMNPESVVVADAFVKKGDVRILEQLQDRCEAIIRVPDWLMAELSEVKTPPGLLVITPREEMQSEFPKCTLAVIAHEVQDPGNIGTILRTAEAAGVGAVLITQQSADPFSPKGLRGSMGAALRIPIRYGMTLEEAVALCHEQGMKVFATSPRSSQSLWDHDWTVPCAVLLGSEGSGLSDAELDRADGEISIPMAGNVESLNVAAAATALLFEAARQRRNG